MGGSTSGPLRSWLPGSITGHFPGDLSLPHSRGLSNRTALSLVSWSSHGWKEEMFCLELACTPILSSTNGSLEGGQWAQEQCPCLGTYRMSEYCKGPSPLPASVSGLIWKDNIVTVQALPRPLSVLGARGLVANQKLLGLCIILSYRGPSEPEKTLNRTLDC